MTERLGGETYLYLQMEGGESLTVKTSGNDRSQLHDRVTIAIDQETCHLFDLQRIALPTLQPFLPMAAPPDHSRQRSQ